MRKRKDPKISRRRFIGNSAAGAFGLSFLPGFVIDEMSSSALKHVWEPVEITFQAHHSHSNPYKDVDVWVQLKGPGFDKKVYGFWDGGQTFRVRVVATSPGHWTWTSGADRDDPGLTGKTGSFDAVEWTEAEKLENPNRRGFLHIHPGGRTMEYRDGTPFFLMADTHWALATWRHPFKGNNPDKDYHPQKGMGFEEFMQYQKQHGYNTMSMIASFPNWDDEDGYGGRLFDDSGIRIRAGWAKPGSQGKAMDMHDEQGNRPFELPGKCDGKQKACANFDRINPAYWRSLDRKFQYMHEIGMLFNMESVRREHLCTWYVYHEFNASFSRYLHYLRARYGCYNQIFSLVHCDSLNFDDINGNGTLSEVQVKEAMQYFFDMYGPLPFGQPVTSMTGDSTLKKLGHPDWLEMHSSSNQRDGQAYPKMRDMYTKTPYKPVMHLEPYYAGAWQGNYKPHRPFGDPPAPGSPRDDYWGRANAWGAVFNGGVAGHVFGTRLFNGVKEPEPNDVWTWYGITRYGCHRQMKHLKEFMLDEGDAMREMELAHESVSPNTTGNVHVQRMSGHAYMLRSYDKRLAVIFFEEECDQAVISGMNNGKSYRGQWYDPRKGEYIEVGKFDAAGGSIQLPGFPGGLTKTKKLEEWVMKLKQIE